MDKNTGRSYSLSKDEILVLLAIKGCTSIRGMFEDDVDKLCDNGVINSMLFHLKKNELIKLNNDSIAINDDLSEMLDNMINADEIAFISSTDTSKPEQSLYIGNESSTYIRFGINENDRAILTCMKTDEAVKEFMELGFIVSSGIREQDYNPMCLENVIEIPDVFGLDKNEISRIDNICGAIIVIDAVTGITARQLIIYNDVLVDYIIVYEKEEVGVYKYSDKLLGEKIEELLEGKKL